MHPQTEEAVYAVRYLADETYQRRIGRQLNKGENVHTLKRNIAYANEGALHRRHHEQQTEQMWCLTVVTNAIVCWAREYHGRAVDTLRGQGRQIDNELLAHIWPTHSVVTLGEAVWGGRRGVLLADSVGRKGRRAS